MREAATRPDVDPEYRNHCAECSLDYVDSGVPKTLLIPTVPVTDEAVTTRPSTTCRTLVGGRLRFAAKPLVRLFHRQHGDRTDGNHPTVVRRGGDVRGVDTLDSLGDDVCVQGRCPAFLRDFVEGSIASGFVQSLLLRHGVEGRLSVPDAPRPAQGPLSASSP